MRDRTEALYERWEATAPYFDQAPASRLEVVEEVRSRTRGLFADPFHRRALALARALDEVAAAATAGRPRGKTKTDHLELAALVK